MNLGEATLPPVASCAAPLGARIHGSPQRGPCVVLVSGIAQLAASWTPVVHALAAQGEVCVVLPDNPGIGRSASVPVPRTCEDHAALIEQTLDSIGCTGPVHVVGLSLGSMIAAALAARLGQRAVSLSMLAGSCRESGRLRLSPASVARMGFRALIGRTGLRGRMPELISPQALAANPGVVDALLQLRRIEGGYAAGALRRQLFAAGRFSLAAHLKHLPKQRAVIVGSLDRLVNPQHSERMAQMLGVPVLTIQGCGHYLAMDGAQQVALALAATLWPTHAG